MQLHSANTMHRTRPSTVGRANAVPTPIRGSRASVVAASIRHPLPQTFRGPKPVAATTETLALDTLFENSKDTSSNGEATKKTTMRIHYSRPDKNYQNWGLHVWGDAMEPTDWERPLKPAGLNQEGVWFDVPLREGARFLGIQVHAGETKSARAEMQVADLGANSEIWLEGDEVPNVLGAVVADPFRDAAPGQLSGLMLPGGALSKNAAIWLDGKTIVWRQPIQDLNGPRKFYLHANSQGELWMNGDGVQGGEITFELQAMSAILPPDLARKYPYLTGCSALRLPPSALDMVTPLVRGQLAVSVRDHKDKVVDATGVQIQGALDAHFAYDGPLGTWRDPQTQKIMVSVWAPTAKSVELLHYQQARGGEETVLPMTYAALGAGVWSAELPDDAMFTYYKYKINVWHPLTSKIETSYAADPYSRSLSANADRTQVVILSELLNDPRVTPEGWTTQPMPAMTRWTDISLYELSVRDFSSQDKTVKPEVRGKFLAFVPEEAALSPGGTTAGLAHLASLRAAGLNHLHLLPFYDFGNVPERAEDQARIEDDLSKYAPDGQEQQRAVLQTADRDAFNWGYDPVLFGVGDGSYATDPDGLPRILELRKMVMSLHKQGWRVVMDLVYNHLLCGGPHQSHSVLDKVVPGYYVRKHEDGEYCTATFGNNTANEMYMCERLIIDDMEHWAVNYKIDGWRWDIMGHFLVSTMEKIRTRLDSLTIEKDGVDGKAQYMYGEAWEFAEVLNNMRGVNCGQKNLAGTKLGSFNDRMRDGAMGGGPWSPWDFQGFVTGLGLAPSTCRGQGDIREQLEMLGLLKDGIQYALAGNLRQYALPDHTGKVTKGEEITAYGLPLGYGKHPCEHISFIGCHDHLTMFDIITEKAPITALAEERVRMQVMCFSLILMSQGIPFLHAGDDILRSKSLDKDSYNSGDHFNGVDWTMETHKLGVGLPVHTKNGTSWHYKRPLLTNPMIKPTKSMMKNTHDIVCSLLKIRYSSPLFRLPSAEAICNQVKFHNTGPKSIAGVIVMELISAGPEAKDLPFGDYTGCDVPAVYDPENERIVIVFNAAPLEKEIPYPESAGTLQLHPLQSGPNAPDARARQSIADNSARQFIIPSRTAAIFVQPR